MMNGGLSGTQVAAVLALLWVLTGCSGHPRPEVRSQIYIPAVQMRASEHPAETPNPVLATHKQSILSSKSLADPDGVCALDGFREAQSVPDEHVRHLILSGGSLNGAFGAGFFLGLAETGKLPPEPTIVTGISTGALQSTFLFLGAGHSPPGDRHYEWAGGAAANASPLDDPSRPALGERKSNYEDLALAYTIRRERDLLKVAPLGGLGMLLEGSKGRLNPLGARLLALISPDTIHDVAFESCRGRKLFVGVADVDNGQAYAIDLTRLAQLAYDQAKYPRLADPAFAKRHMLQIRQAYVSALIASSSVPVGAQPVTLLLDANNAKPGEERIRHLFVDGGARFGVFLDDVQNDQNLNRLAKDEYGVTLLVNTRLTMPPWRVEDDRLRPKKGWLLSTLGLRTVSILENQVYRLSVEAVENAAGKFGGLHMAHLHNENLHPAGQDDGREWPDDHVFRGKSCAQWHDDNERDLHPAQFYPDYMACLIDYGRQRGQAGLWNVVKNAPQASGK